MPEVLTSSDRIVEFLNSRGVGFSAGEDQLKNGASALEVCRLFDPSIKDVDARTLPRLRELRDTLLAMLQPSSTRKARAALDGIAATVSFSLSFSQPDKATWFRNSGHPVIGKVLIDVAELINNDQWDRLKNCANESCASTFYDVSRSKTQRWHSYAICGNKNNVAAFRSRNS